MSPARSLAADILRGAPRDVPARLDRALVSSPLVAEDRALLSEIVNGTLRMRRRIDHALSSRLPRGGDRLAPLVRAILESAAYQLLFLSRVPAYAAVNDAVELARTRAHAGAAGFVNAVLRSLARRPDAPPLPDAGRDPVAALGTRLSYPDWIVERAIDLLGAEEAERFLESGNCVPPATLRANRRRGGREALLSRLAQEGIAAAKCAAGSDGVRLEGRAFLPSLSALRDGLASVQDESAMLVADLVDPAPGETIVDLCASPGGKALAIAERAAAGTRVIAVDRAPRLTRLRENVARLGLGGGPPDGARVEVRAGDALTLEPIPADVVLVDAPCSGLGVLRRHADLRWTKRAADVARLARVQREILDAAAAWVRPGGHLVYSTCSILREENEAVVEAFLARRRDFALDPLPPALRDLAGHAAFLRTWPQRHGMDGAFACRLSRAAP